jgi:hypothetical protein
MSGRLVGIHPLTASTRPMRFRAPPASSPGGEAEEDGTIVHRRYSPYTAFSLASLPHRIFEYGLVARLTAALSTGNLDDATGSIDDIRTTLAEREPHNSVRSFWLEGRTEPKRDWRREVLSQVRRLSDQGRTSAFISTASNACSTTLQALRESEPEHSSTN